MSLSNRRYHNVSVGIDPSSKKLAAVITAPHGVSLDQVVFETKMKERIEACEEAFYWIQNLMYQLSSEYPNKKIYVFVEAPVLGRGGAGATIPQALVCGAVLAAARTYGANTYLVNNQQWKKHVVGRGNASKDDVTDTIKEVWPYVYQQATFTTARGLVKLDQDMLDAAAINKYGRHIVRIENLLRKERNDNNRAVTKTARKIRQR